MQDDFKDWMLPEGIAESLPDDAITLNYIEQQALKIFTSWGYQLLRTPLVEYASTFTKNAMNDYLANQTVQFKDQKSGRQLGFRSDFTPQISRIDAHYIQTEGVARYAYAGEVVRSYPEGHDRLRNPSIVGVELLGNDSSAADVEVVSLLLDYLKKIGIQRFTLSLSHIDVVAEILHQYGISESYFPSIFDFLANKDKESLIAITKKILLDNTSINKLIEITEMYGDISVIEKMKNLFGSDKKVTAKIQLFEQLVKDIQSTHPDIDMHIDFADIHGYGYHNGLIFSVHHENIWQSIARGGRYDSLGNNFSENIQIRPSIGFSCNLNLISGLVSTYSASEKIIRCDFDLSKDKTLFEWVRTLRKDYVVIAILENDTYQSIAFTHKISKQDEIYVLIPFN